MTTTAEHLLEQLRTINRTSAFNRWSGIEVLKAAPGAAEIGLTWNDDLGQYAGFMHAGVVGALIDTACGYAAVTVAGARVLASHFSVNCLRPAIGESFIARARVVKAGRTQVFTTCELFGVRGGDETLVATGETLLTVVQAT